MKDIEKKSIGTIAIHGGQEKNPYPTTSVVGYKAQSFHFFF